MKKLSDLACGEDGCCYGRPNMGMSANGSCECLDGVYGDRRVNIRAALGYTQKLERDVMWLKERVAADRVLLLGRGPDNDS